MDGLRARLWEPLHLATEGHKAYLKAVEGDPDTVPASMSYVERQNLALGMGMRRFTCLTNAFSKKLENHIQMLSLLQFRGYLG